VRSIARPAPDIKDKFFPEKEAAVKNLVHWHRGAEVGADSQ